MKLLILETPIEFRLAVVDDDDGDDDNDDDDDNNSDSQQPTTVTAVVIAHDSLDTVCADAKEISFSFWIR